MRSDLLCGLLLVGALVGGCHGDGDGTGEPDAGLVLPKFDSTCTPGATSDAARKVAGRSPDGTVILPGGRMLTPAGRVLDLGGFPLGLRVLPGDRYAVVTDGAYGYEALRIIDLQAADPHKAVVDSHEYPRTTQSPQAPGLFLGMALTRDGKRLYVSNGGYDPVASGRPAPEHYNTLDVFDIAGSPPRLLRQEAGTLKLMWNTDGKPPGAAEHRLPAGITLSADERLLYVACQGDASLAIVDLAQGKEIGRAALPGIGPYDVAVDEAGHTAFVSLWGGTDLGAQAPMRYVDGVAVVNVVDPAKPTAMMDPLPTGKGAEAVLLSGGALYVANADADTVSVVDLGTRAVKSLPVSTGMLVGDAPNHLAVDVARGRLYVAAAGANAVVALDLKSGALLGAVPTAWYPTVVSVLGDGTLIIASAKGLGLGPIDQPPWDANYSYMQGVVQVVAAPSVEELRMGDVKVAANFDRPRALAATPSCPEADARFPLPVPSGASDFGGPGATPIRQVFLVVRENKTYDALLGDLAGTEGDPKLVLFGEHESPNAHALARGFTVLDNFYSLAEQSLQGHEWTTAAIANDYTEKAWQTTWGRAWRPATTFAIGVEARLAMPGSDTIWKHLERAGVAYKNYGEVVNTQGAKAGPDGRYPGLILNLDVLDVEKVSYLIDQFESPVPFSYVVLPNDHTYGTSPGKPTPQSMVADNDEATGRFVDALSRSPLWPTSIVFVIEDDPSDGGDHVEPHRSPALVISPWVKRGYVSKQNYDVAAVYRTIELLLGVAPMNDNDAHAAPMYDLFTTTPDYSPYTFIPRKVAPGVNSVDAPLADESRKIDFSRADTAPLGRILWKAVHGKDAEPPWRKMGLRWEAERDDD